MQFYAGDRILCPSTHCTLPFPSQVTDLNCLIATPGHRKATELCHLKSYYDRDSVSIAAKLPLQSPH